jgi:hypothetical protein
MNSNPMTTAFDIFRMNDEGRPRWIEGALTLDDAIARVKQLDGLQTGEYFIRSQKTGVEVSLKAGQLAIVGPKFSGRTESLTMRLRPQLKAAIRNHIDLL